MMKNKVRLLIIAVVVVIAVAGIIGAEYYTSRPQFCGSCHIMKQYYNQYTNDKHSEKNVLCVDCHYAPGTKMSPEAKFKGLGQLFTYLGAGGTTVEKVAKVPDASCTTSECHPKTEEFLNKKVKFTDKIPYVHKTHEDKKIEGQELHCDTCHQHITPDKHFQVPKTSCYLCHFKNTEFNKERSKCSLCHEIPTQPLKKQESQGSEEAKPDEKLITHQSLEEAKVPCASCHYELVEGKGEIKKENCFECHNYSEEMLKKAEDKKLMHQEHVASQSAHCFECHAPIEHRERDHMELATSNCTACHPDHHVQQKMLLAGTGGKGTKKDYPIRHFAVKVNCFACHTKDDFDYKGVKVIKADTLTCAACHSEDEKNLAVKWKSDILDILKEAREIEKQAIEAVEAAKGQVPESTIKKAMTMLAEGQANLTLVEAGGGVHNKKYSVLLLDIATEKFYGITDEVLAK